MDEERIRNRKEFRSSDDQYFLNKKMYQRTIDPCSLNFDTNEIIFQCGLERNYDLLSDDDGVEMSSCKKMNDSLKVSKNVIRQSIHPNTNENNINSKMKNLFKDIVRKEKTIEDLNVKNSHLELQLEKSRKNTAHHNAHLMELANANNRLQKEIERKNLDISELQLQINKKDNVNSNLLKDIDFYKSELNNAKTQNLNRSEIEYEILQKKFYEIKIENGKLCRKFKQIRSSDDDYSKTPSYHLLNKKYEYAQHDLAKLKMQNKKLKDKIRKKDEELNERFTTISKHMNEEIAELLKIKTTAEDENEKLKAMLDKVQTELSISKSSINNLQNELEGKTAQCEQQKHEITDLKATCTQLQCTAEELLVEKEEFMKQHLINEENNNILKLKLDELTRAKSELLANPNSSAIMENQEVCENCFFLKQEIEKLGYANLRLKKEKHVLHTRFQKLSIRASKLTLKLEEEIDKHKVHGEGSKCGNDENLLQQNVLLSKRLNNLLKKSEKLFKVQMEGTKTDKDCVGPNHSNDNVIDELNANLSCSKSHLEKIEIKLNEEEWKLNAALKHIRSVKEQIQKEI